MEGCKAARLGSFFFPRTGNLDSMMAWAGQSAGLAVERSASDVVTELWIQVKELLGEGPRSRQ